MLTQPSARVQVGRREWQPNQTWYWIGWYFWDVVFRLLGPLRVRGAENVPPSGALILASNHSSGLDPFALAKGCPRWPHFLAKQELFRVPVIRYIIRQWGAIPIDRDAADLGSARAALRVLRAGEALAIFPEGTRSATGELGEFRPGTVNLALKRRVPIVPVAIRGTAAVLPKGSLVPRRHVVDVAFGQPLHLWEVLPDDSEASRQAGARLLRQRVQKLLDEMG